VVQAVNQASAQPKQPAVDEGDNLATF